MNRLSKDNALDAPDIFYPGFHFSESTGSEHDFGTDLLRLLIRKWPKSPEAKSARMQLGLTRPAPVARKTTTSKKKLSAKKRPTPKKNPVKRKKP